jgi:hypothetical protein
MKRLMTLATTLVMAMVLVLAFATPAMAEDAYPCGYKEWHNGTQRLVQYCDMWRGNVPVYQIYGDGHIASGPGDTLVSAEGNWFTCQQWIPNAPYTVPGTNYTNHWWAYTMADNGDWGWVSVAYFRGGGNDEPDGRLVNCFAE